jgi:Cytochrome C'
MRVVILIMLTGLLLGFVAASRGEKASAPATGPEELAAETQPSEGKKKLKPIDDEIKALGLRPCSVSAIMGRWKTAKIEKKLKTWSEDGSADFQDAHKTGLNVAGMAKLVEWSKNKHRNTDPKAHDQLISELEASGKKLAESGRAKDAEGVKQAASDINRKCSDCHSRFK